MDTDEEEEEEDDEYESEDEDVVVGVREGWEGKGKVAELTQVESAWDFFPDGAFLLSLLAQQ